MAVLDRKNLQDDYLIEKNEVVKSARKEFQGKTQSIRLSIENGINSAERHRNSLNTCIFPFTRSRGILRSSTGYEFMHASPLSELGIQNNDFLLLKSEDKHKTAIIGEVKGAVSSANHVVSEARTRLAAAMNHVEYIKTEYLNLPVKETVHFEYVLAVPMTSSNDVLNSVIDSGGGMITWSVPITGDAEIRLVFPPKSLTNGVKRGSMMHRDHGLNEALGNGIPSDRNEFSTFPQMHACLELKSVLRVLRREGAKVVVDRDRLRDLLSRDLFYMDDKYIDSRADSVIDEGQAIGFLEPTQNQGIFKAIAQGKNLNILEKTLQKKWIDIQIVRKEERFIETQIAKLQERFRIRKDKERVWF